MVSSSAAEEELNPSDGACPLAFTHREFHPEISHGLLASGLTYLNSP